MTPEEKLCSRTWRMRNSAGVLWSILSFGFLTAANFLIRGIKAKNKLWITYGAAFAALTIILMVWISGVETGTKENPVQSTSSTVWGWVWFSQWIAGIVLSATTNRRWLLWKAHHVGRAWYAQPPTVDSAPAWQAAIRNEQRAPALQPLVQTPVLQSVQQPLRQPNEQISPEPMNINTMELGDFERLGMEYAAARQILDMRPQVGQYTSFEHLLGSSRVPPHLLLPFKGSFSFRATSERSSASEAPSRPRSGRTLDL
jgi:hypothetical protein